MRAVIVIGNDGGKIMRELYSAFSQNGGAFMMSDNEISVPERFEFMLLPGDKKLDIKACPSILVFCGELYESLPFTPPANSIAIVESGNQNAMLLLKTLGLRTVTCGMSATDTVSLSSISDKAAAVSLQRELPTDDFGVIDACEISVKQTRPYSEYGVMATVSVLFLSRGEESVITL